MVFALFLYAGVQFVTGSECLHRLRAILCLVQNHLLLREIFAALTDTVWLDRESAIKWISRRCRGSCVSWLVFHSSVLNPFCEHTSDAVPYLLLLFCPLTLFMFYLFIDFARTEVSRSLLHIRRVAMFRKSLFGWSHLHFSLVPNARQPVAPCVQTVVLVDTCIDLIVVPLEIEMELWIILVDCQEGI